jgi:hypothetical protein
MRNPGLNTFPGHAAWLDWPWKLHRIEKNNEVKCELYSLTTDPMEETDVSDQNKERVQQMKLELKKWQESVVHSLNSDDYEM